MITAERFAEGITFAVYVDTMQENRAAFAAAFAAFALRPQDHAALQTVARSLRVLVLTEDWCGDSLLYLPVVGRMAADAGWALQLFRRAATPDVEAAFSAAGLRRAIPTVVFYDAAMQPVAHFIERPAQVTADRQAAIDALAAAQPEVQAGVPNAAQSPAARLIT
ncbi:MAG: thioredoxin family protein, partial [Chloroflexota bacterium]|nr:thioredoxin family protein [Chloroflexota bacterium]